MSETSTATNTSLQKTPLQMLETILTQATEQQPHLFVYQPHPAENLFYAMLRLADIKEAHPYVLCRFDNRTIYKSGTTVAPFFERVGKDLIDTQRMAPFQIFDEFRLSAANHKDKLFQPQVEISDETSFAYVWSNEVDRRGLSQFFIYSAPKAAVAEFLATEERKGAVKYHYWSADLHYTLSCTTLVQTVFSPQIQASTAVALEQCYRNIERIAALFKPYEALMREFVVAANQR